MLASLAAGHPTGTEFGSVDLVYWLDISMGQAMTLADPELLADPYSTLKYLGQPFDGGPIPLARLIDVLVNFRERGRVEWHRFPATNYSDNLRSRRSNLL